MFRSFPVFHSRQKCSTCSPVCLLVNTWGLSPEVGLVGHRMWASLTLPDAVTVFCVGYRSASRPQPLRGGLPCPCQHLVVSDILNTCQSNECAMAPCFKKCSLWSLMMLDFFWLFGFWVLTLPLTVWTWEMITHSEPQSSDVLKNILFIYLASPGLSSCPVWDLRCGMWDLVPRPGIEPGPPALGAWSLNHWTTRDVPLC